MSWIVKIARNGARASLFTIAKAPTAPKILDYWDTNQLNSEGFKILETPVILEADNISKVLPKEK